MNASWSPLAVSLWVAGWASLISLALGVTLGWLLARRSFRGKWLVESLVMLPLVLPPTVLGYYLLVALGQRGLGPWLEAWLGWQLIFSRAGAVLAAAVAALPLVAQAVRVSMAEVDTDLESAARADGASEWQLFWRVTLPLAWRGVLAGWLLGFLRAFGDFGATLMVAGDIPGRTRTLSIALYDLVQANQITQANQTALWLTAGVFSLLYLVLRLQARK